MPIVISHHARKQLKERNISEQRVMETIINPDEILTSFKNRQLRRKRFSDMILEVVTVTEDARITVITTYYLE